MYIYIYVCMCVRARVCVCVYVYVCKHDLSINNLQALVGHITIPNLNE